MNVPGRRSVGRPRKNVEKGNAGVGGWGRGGPELRKREGNHCKSSPGSRIKELMMKMKTKR